MGSYASPPSTPNRHERQRERVVAAQNSKRFGQTPAQIANALHAAARFFDGHNVAAFFRQTHHCFGHDIHATASGNIVEHYRQGCDGGDALEMAEESLLTWAVGIGRDGASSMDADFLGALCVYQHVVGWICAGSP